MGRQGRRIQKAQWDELLDALRKGNTRQAACGVARMSDQSLLNRLHDDLEFLEEVTRAEREAEAFYAGVLQNAAPDDWRAAESWLKRRRREDWGDTLDLRKLSDDQVVRLLESEASAGSGEAGPSDPALANGHGRA